MRETAHRAARVILCAILLGLARSSFGLTLEEIRQIPDLTPRKFASLFSEFKFKFRAEVQEPRVFLATESGDCDDYSTLAADVLRERGYTPRLITIRMPNLVHVVCYIEETKCYLDYNNRSFFARTVSSGTSLEDIAKKVAKSSSLPWISASEFTFAEGEKRLVKTVLSSKAEGRPLASLSQ